MVVHGVGGDHELIAGREAAAARGQLLDRGAARSLLVL
jgi:hypothetical protein